jgi:hypothetical protein
MHVVTIREGVTSSQTNAIGPAPFERAIAAQHAQVGADFLVTNSDGSYSLSFPSLNHYREFLADIADSSASDEEKVDVLRRHSDAH